MTTNSKNWAAQGACQTNPNLDALFVKGAAQNRTKSICMGCPVRTECLATALDTRTRFGIWGGMTEGKRRALIKKNPAVKSWWDTLVGAKEVFELTVLILNAIRVESFPSTGSYDTYDRIADVLRIDKADVRLIVDHLAKIQAIRWITRPNVNSHAGLELCTSQLPSQLAHAMAGTVKRKPSAKSRITLVTTTDDIMVVILQPERLSAETLQALRALAQEPNGCADNPDVIQAIFEPIRVSVGRTIGSQILVTLESAGILELKWKTKARIGCNRMALTPAGADWLNKHSDLIDEILADAQQQQVFREEAARRREIRQALEREAAAQRALQVAAARAQAKDKKVTKPTQQPKATAGSVSAPQSPPKQPRVPQARRPANPVRTRKIDPTKPSAEQVRLAQRAIGSVLDDRLSAAAFYGILTTALTEAGFTDMQVIPAIARALVANGTVQPDVTNRRQPHLVVNHRI